jgi:hypothetical protein
MGTDLFPEITGWAREEAEKRGLTKPAKPAQAPRRPSEGPVLDYSGSRPEVGRTYLADFADAGTGKKLERDAPSGNQPDRDLDYAGIRDELAVKVKLPPTGEERRRAIAKEQQRVSEKQTHEFLLDHGPSLD